jgi:DNA-binding protein HU-beta
MNKRELAARLAEKYPEEFPSRAAADRALTALVEVITDGLREDGSVQLIGFGTFLVRDQVEREGRNPRTQEAIRIPASRRVAFRAGKPLKEAVADG